MYVRRFKSVVHRMMANFWIFHEVSFGSHNRHIYFIYISGCIWKNKIHYTYENSIILMTFWKQCHDIIYFLLFPCTVFTWVACIFLSWKKTSWERCATFAKVTQNSKSYDMSQETSVETAAEHAPFLISSLAISLHINSYCFLLQTMKYF